MPKTHLRIPVVTTLALAGLVGAAATGLVLARPDPVTTTAVRPAALPVQVHVPTLQDGFTLERSFSGRVQASRQSELGFESAGRLAQVLVDEGSVVEAGQLLAELDRERLTAQRNELVAAQAQAEANLALANVTLRRLRGVVDRGGVSRQDLDEAREAQRAAEAALQLAEQRIETMDIELAKTRLKAPFAATVIARAADEGRVLEAGHAVLVVQERATPEIRIGIAGRALDQLQPGHVYQALWRGQAIEARLRTLLPVRAATARTVDALFDPVDPPAGMLAGDTVTLVLESHVARRGSWLPLSALAEGERGLWSLYLAEPLLQPDDVLGATHRIVRHTVEVLHQSADRVFVNAVWGSNSQVVSTGLQRIVPGQMVRLGATAPALAEVRHD